MSSRLSRWLCIMIGHKKHEKAQKGAAELDATAHAWNRTAFCLFVSFCAFSWLTNLDPRIAQRARAETTSPFESEIAAFEKWDRQNAVPRDAILFVGSSSIRLWQTADSFPDLPVINRGFGGSTIADVNHFADRIVFKYKPRVIVFYAGDNDIAGGKSPQQVFADFKQFVERVGKAIARHERHLPFHQTQPVAREAVAEGDAGKFAYRRTHEIENDLCIRRHRHADAWRRRQAAQGTFS